MVFPVDLFQPLAGDVSIYLGGGKITMAEQQLHHAKVRPVVEQVGGESVPQRVRRDLTANARCGGVAFVRSHAPARNTTVRARSQ